MATRELNRCGSDCALREGEHFLRWEPASIADLLNKLGDLAEDGGSVFRGMPDATYKLHSTLDRQLETATWESGRNGASRHLEQAIFRQFTREAHHYIDALPSRDVLEWLSIMRHYGVPTRLLDWSYSPFVALFFAAAFARAGCCASVWALKTNATDDAARAIAGKKARARWEDDLHCTEPSTFFDLYNASKPQRFVLKQNCARRNPRIIAQQGVFLCPGDVEVCFQRNLSATLEKWNKKKFRGEEKRGSALVRIDFQASLATKILQRLHRLGLSNAALYPDIEGFAKHLALLPRMPALQALDLEMPGIGASKRPRRRGS